MPFRVHMYMQKQESTFTNWPNSLPSRLSSSSPLPVPLPVPPPSPTDTTEAASPLPLPSPLPSVRVSLPTSGSAAPDPSSDFRVVVATVMDSDDPSVTVVSLPSPSPLPSVVLFPLLDGEEGARVIYPGAPVVESTAGVTTTLMEIFVVVPATDGTSVADVNDGTVVVAVVFVAVVVLFEAVVVPGVVTTDGAAVAKVTIEKFSVVLTSNAEISIALLFTGRASVISRLVSAIAGGGSVVSTTAVASVSSAVGSEEVSFRALFSPGVRIDSTLAKVSGNVSLSLLIVTSVSLAVEFWISLMISESSSSSSGTLTTSVSFVVIRSVWVVGCCRVFDWDGNHLQSAH
jgi:hypothetical protein